MTTFAFLRCMDIMKTLVVMFNILSPFLSALITLLKNDFVCRLSQEVGKSEIFIMIFIAEMAKFIKI